MEELWGRRSDPAVAQLFNDLAHGRLSHAYLFLGGSREDRKRVAESFAAAARCLEAAPGACGNCASCRAFGRGTHPDFHVIAPDGPAFKIAQVRALHHLFCSPPLLGKRHVFFFLGPELMTPPAANSILKILEEPPARTLFLLVAQEERLPLPTVVSRCRVVRLRGEVPAGRLLLEGSPAFARVWELLWEEKPALLLREVREIGGDRARAQELVEFLEARLEGEYREKLKAGAPQEVVFSLAECLKSLLKCRTLLEENLYPPLLLALTLRRVQQDLHNLSRN